MKAQVHKSEVYKDKKSNPIQDNACRADCFLYIHILIVKLNIIKILIEEIEKI